MTLRLHLFEITVEFNNLLQGSRLVHVENEARAVRDTEVPYVFDDQTHDTFYYLSRADAERVITAIQRQGVPGAWQFQVMRVVHGNGIILGDV